MSELTSLKMTLVLLATPGIIAPAATATKTAIYAYSICTTMLDVVYDACGLSAQ